MGSLITEKLDQQVSLNMEHNVSNSLSAIHPDPDSLSKHSKQADSNWNINGTASAIISSDNNLQQYMQHSIPQTKRVSPNHFLPQGATYSHLRSESQNSIPNSKNLDMSSPKYQQDLSQSDLKKQKEET
jgi:hypothetical protein